MPTPTSELSYKSCPGSWRQRPRPGSWERSDRRMRLLWASLLCWALPPPAQGRAHSLIYLRISKNQLEIDISDLFAEQQILSRVVRVPVTGTPGEGATVLDHLPFVSKSLSKKSSGLDLSLVGDLLSGKSLPLLSDLLQAGGLVIEDARGPEVTLQILSDSLLQVTLRCKLYLSLQGILRLKVIKNIRMGVRLEQTGNRTTVALEECHTPPGSLSVEILGQDHLPAAASHFCSNFLQASDGSRGSVGLTINTPDPPTVHLIGHTATVTQQGSLVLLGPNSTSSSISWKLLSTATFSSTNQKLKLQFSPNSAVVTLGPYPAVLKKQEEQLRASLSQFLKRRFLPHHNAQLRGHSLPLPNVKGLSFNQAHMDLSEDYLLLTIPE
uniref:uncharacterized protein LOC106145035 n=1 Tax=Ictidomys tridecemlineatus TaxID=43179 RepID=UPI001A9F377F|nr:uncharacterized protein LOC106145035 [Ictidomys tridecemlineatus]